jgi:hypothetical protein
LDRFTFFLKEGTSEEHAVTASELALCYLNMKHCLICSIFDCNTNLGCNIFSDSIVGSKLYGGRTKAEALVTNVLTPSSIIDFLEMLFIACLLWDKLNYMVSM